MLHISSPHLTLFSSSYLTFQNFRRTFCHAIHGLSPFIIIFHYHRYVSWISPVCIVISQFSLIASKNRVVSLPPNEHTLDGEQSSLALDSPVADIHTTFDGWSRVECKLKGREFKDIRHPDSSCVLWVWLLATLDPSTRITFILDDLLHFRGTLLFYFFFVLSSSAFFFSWS